MNIPRGLAIIAIAPAVATLVTATAAHAAVGISRAELQGTQLRVEGSGAVPQHTVTVNPGGVTGTADGNGAFKIETANYSSPTCQISVTDGTTSMSATLSGCTPTTSSSTTTTSSSTTTPTSTSTTTTSAPAVTVQPGSLTFPSEPTGTSSPAQTVAVQNTGTASLFINGLSPSGIAAVDFTVTRDMCSGTTVAPGSSCALTITFTPTADGTRTASLGVLDNAPASPQAIGLTGTGAGTVTGATPLSVYTGGMTCTSAGCDVAGGSQIVNNFFAGLLTAQGGTAPYSFSTPSALPPGLTMTTGGLLSGTLTATGTFSFPVTVHDGAGASSTALLSLSVVPSPAPGSTSCQKGSNVKESLTGQPIAGRTPAGLAQEDESKLTACGGFGILSVNVNSINLPNGTVLWIYLDSKPVGTITLSNGSGAIRPYNLGNFALRFDHVTVVNGPPPLVNGQPTVVAGGSFS